MVSVLQIRAKSSDIAEVLKYVAANLSVELIVMEGGLWTNFGFCFTYIVDSFLSAKQTKMVKHSKHKYNQGS